MAQQPLTTEAIRSETGSGRLVVTGELDFDTAPTLVAAAAELRAEGRHELTIELGGVTRCDASGLSAFVELVKTRGSGSIRLVGVGDELQRLLDRTGLAEVLAAAPADRLRGVG